MPCCPNLLDWIICKTIFLLALRRTFILASLGLRSMPLQSSMRTYTITTSRQTPLRSGERCRCRRFLRLPANDRRLGKARRGFVYSRGPVDSPPKLESTAGVRKKERKSFLQPYGKESGPSSPPKLGRSLQEQTNASKIIVASNVSSFKRSGAYLKRKHASDTQLDAQVRVTCFLFSSKRMRLYVGIAWRH